MSELQAKTCLMQMQLDEEQIDIILHLSANKYYSYSHVAGNGKKDQQAAFFSLSELD